MKPKAKGQRKNLSSGFNRYGYNTKKGRG